MNLADLTLSGASIITKNIPYFQGIRTLYRLFNRTIIRFAANPIVTVKMKDGTTMLIDLRTITELDAFYRGEYDSNLIDIIQHLLNPNYYFLDIGANIGFYTISISAFIRSKGALGQVIAFEPFEGNYNRLLANLKTNNLDNFCSTHKIGLSDESRDSFITLREDFMHGSNTGNASISINEKFDSGLRKVLVKLERLDDIWKQLYGKQIKIDLIKMDIEGHEDLCLQGGLEIIEKHRPTILMEVNKPYYDARGLNLDNTFFPLIPKEYFIDRQVEKNNIWKRINSIDYCNTIDNIFLIPQEKLNCKGYEIFDLSN